MKIRELIKKLKELDPERKLVITLKNQVTTEDDVSRSYLVAEYLFNECDLEEEIKNEGEGVDRKA